MTDLDAILTTPAQPTGAGRFAYVRLGLRVERRFIVDGDQLTAHCPPGSDLGAGLAHNVTSSPTPLS
jgi:hypothetical protein